MWARVRRRRLRDFRGAAPSNLWQIGEVRAGLRPQIVLLLALLLCVSFVPLYFAVSIYTRTAHSVMQRQQAVELAATLAGPVQALDPPTEHELRRLLGGRIVALQVLGPNPAVGVGDVPSLQVTELRRLSANESPQWIASPEGTWVGRHVNENKTLWALVTPQPALLGRLNVLLLSYMLITGLVLLAGVYFLVTQRIIRPIDELSHAARRVTSTDRPLVLPGARSREFEELNQSLRAMTERLLREEAALRSKITELETRTQQLRSAQAQLARSERLASAGQLAAGVAHEIGNPIAALMGLQDLILSGGLSDDEQTEFVRRMRKETERIHRIVRELLNFARPRPAAPNDANSGCSVAQALAETLDLLRPQPSFRDVTIRTPQAQSLPHVAMSHEALVQIFLNLLLNAAAACGGSGNVVIEAQPWRSPQDTHARFLEVSVQDDGPGVPLDLRSTLFEPFVSGKDVGEGTGLGLSVCRNLVDEVATTTGSPHVGLELDQTFTSGARFVMRLPMSSQTT